jgi:hypothetical protein
MQAQSEHSNQGNTIVGQAVTYLKVIGAHR